MNNLFGSLLAINSTLLTHSSKDNNVYTKLALQYLYLRLQSLLTGVLSVVSEELGNLVTNFTIGDLDIVLEGTIFVHKREKAIIGDVELWNKS